MAGDFHLNIELDSKEVQDKINGTALKMRSISKKIMTAVNREVIKIAKTNVKQNFNTNNKDKYKYEEQKLLKGFKNFNSKKEDFASFLSNNVFYSRFLENGAEIKPRHKYLTFKINGEFKKSKGVTLPAKPFLKPAISDIWETNKYQAIADATLQKELTKYWEKNG